MKIPSLRQFLVFVAAASLLVFGLSAVSAHAGPLAAVALLLAFSLPTPSFSLGVTLTTPGLLNDVAAAFIKEFPFLRDIAAEFRRADKPLKLNQEYIAHVATYGSASTYDSTTGYANGANAARNGLVDVAVVTDQHPTYPLKWLHLDAIKDEKMTYGEVMAGAGYVLGKKVVDDGVFAKCNGRYFSHELVKATADFDYDFLQAITSAGNNQKMASVGRIMVITTAVAEVLGVDPRMISKEFAGQLQDGRAYREWRNVGGFAKIIEYPDLPTNNATALTGVTGANSGDLMTKVAHGLVTGDPVTFVSGTTFTGLTAGTRYFAIRASADTFQVATTRALAVAGTAVALGADGTSGVFQLQENLTAMVFDKRAFAFLQGVPDGIDGAHATSLGIPQVLAVEPVQTPSGIALAAAKWQEGGTGDYFWVPNMIFGTNAGKQCKTAVAGNTAAANSALAAASLLDTGFDQAGLRITSGAS